MGTRGAWPIVTRSVGDLNYNSHEAFHSQRQKRRTVGRLRAKCTKFRVPKRFGSLENAEISQLASIFQIFLNIYISTLIFQSLTWIWDENQWWSCWNFPWGKHSDLLFLFLLSTALKRGSCTCFCEVLWYTRMKRAIEVLIIVTPVLIILSGWGAAASFQPAVGFSRCPVHSSHRNNQILIFNCFKKEISLCSADATSLWWKFKSTCVWDVGIRAVIKGRDGKLHLLANREQSLGEGRRRKWLPARVRCSEICCAQHFKTETTTSNIWERSDFYLFPICHCSYLFTLRFVLSLGRPKRSTASSVSSEKLSRAAQLSQFQDKLCLPGSIASSQGSWSWKASALALLFSRSAWLCCLICVSGILRLCWLCVFVPAKWSDRNLGDLPMVLQQRQPAWYKEAYCVC